MRRAFSGAWKFHARSGISTARPHYGISIFLWNFHAPKDGSYVESGRLGRICREAWGSLDKTSAIIHTKPPCALPSKLPRRPACAKSLTATMTTTECGRADDRQEI